MHFIKYVRCSAHKHRTNLVLPFKLCPHLSELCICAGSWLDVVHNVNVDVTEDHAVSVAGSPRHVVHLKQNQTILRQHSRLHNGRIEQQEQKFASHQCCQI